VTIEGSDGRRYLVYRDGTPVVTAGKPIRLDDLDPASRRIVEALLAAVRADQPPHDPAPDKPQLSAGPLGSRRPGSGPGLAIPPRDLRSSR
jgi:hypothetical protein